MAMPTASPAPAPSAQVVGIAFVEQFYHILHQSPELVYRFYQDSSKLSRPESDGTMTSVTTMKAINDKILSLDYQDYKAEIKTVDAQDSYNDGVMVLVTGCLTGKDNMPRRFTQSFFLAPQDKGYFVFNDVFRYVDENKSPETNPATVNGTVESAATAPLTTDPESTHISEHPVMEPAISLVKDSLDNGEEVCDPSDNEEGSVVDVEVVAESAAYSSQNEVDPVTLVTESASSDAQEDAPKKSYASILKVMNRNTVRTPVYVPANNAVVAPVKTEQQSAGFAAPGPEASAPSSNNTPESSDSHEEVEGHSIYIRSLPMNASVAEVEEEFKKFGTIKANGVQVRSNKQQGYCFGFVEFEALSSMQSALKASPITIGGRQVFVEQKRTTSRVVSGRTRFPSSRGGVQNDNFRGRGNFGGGRGYGRNEYGNRGEFSGRGRGPSGRSGEGYQRVNQNGNGRSGRQGGANQTAVSE